MWKEIFKASDVQTTRESQIEFILWEGEKDKDDLKWYSQPFYMEVYKSLIIQEPIDIIICIIINILL